MRLQPGVTRNGLVNIFNCAACRRVINTDGALKKKKEAYSGKLFMRLKRQRAVRFSCIRLISLLLRSKTLVILHAAVEFSHDKPL